MKSTLNLLIFEFRKICKDKKVLLSLLVLPIITALGIVLMLNSTGSNKKSDKEFNIYVLDNMIEEQSVGEDDYSINLKPVDAKNLKQVKKEESLKEEDVVLDIKNNEVYYFSHNNESKQNMQIAKNILLTQYYEMFIGANDLKPIDMVDLESGKFDILTLMVPYFVVILLFVAVTNQTNDSIAGEKERGTFEKLLLSPVNNNSIVSSKILTASIVGILTVVIFFVSFMIFTNINIGAKSNVNALSFDIDLKTILLILLYSFILCYLYASIGVLVSLVANTRKQAKSYILPIYGLNMVLSIITMIRSGVMADKYYAIPVTNFCLIMQDLLMDMIDTHKVLVAVVSIFILSVVISIITNIFIRSEKLR